MLFRSWLVGGRRATQGAVTTAVRKEGLHLQAGIGQGSRVISSVQEPCSTLAAVGHFGHRFSAFWPRFLTLSIVGSPRAKLYPFGRRKLFRSLPL